jgi:uncharacterized protein YjdB
LQEEEKKMRTVSKKFLTALAAMSMLMLLVIFPSTANALTSEGFDGGSGTQTDPWQISTLSQLQLVRNHLTGHFILTQNITLSGTWKPIGYNSTTDKYMFSGSFNGNGKTIFGLYVVGNYSSPTDTSLDKSKVGFFGSAKNATIKNVTLKGTSVSGGADVGSLLGFSEGNLTVDNCHSSVNVSASGITSGGLIGAADIGIGSSASGARISNSSYSGTISGEMQTGGLVGRAKRTNTSESSPMITRCKTTGNVSGTTEVGGIIGEAYGNITQCYSTGSITGSGSKVGGIAGTMMASGDYYGTLIYDSYSLGNIRGDSSVGGIGGYSYETEDSPAAGAVRCYAAGTIESTAGGNTGGIIGKFGNSNWGEVSASAILSPSIRQSSSTKTTVQPIQGTAGIHHRSSYYRSDIQLIAKAATVPSTQSTAIPLAQLKLESTYASTLKWKIGENQTWKWNATYSRPELNIDPIVLTISATSKSIFINDMFMLTASPNVSSNQWWSDNPKVATVVNGLVTGIAEGKTTIWVKPTNGGAVSCVVDVKKPDYGTFTVEVTLEEGQTSLLNGYTTYADGHVGTVKPKWTSSKASVASINASGLVTALSAGSTIITGVNSQVPEQKPQQIRVRVVPSYPVVSVNIVPDTIELALGESEGIDYEINPTNANNQRVVWYSSNEDVVKVDSGIIETVGAGAATVGVVTVDGGFTDTVPVYVEYAMSGIEVTPDDTTVVRGNQLQMKAASIPAEPVAPNVTWSSEDESIATVDASGMLTAVSAGTVKITATSVNYTGVSGFAEVEIREPIIETLANWSNFPLGSIAPYKANADSYYQSSAGLTAVGNNIVVSRDSDVKLKAIGWDDASATNEKAWQATFETTDMKNIRFSAAQSANNKSPNNFIAEYSLNGTNWKPIVVTTDAISGDTSSEYFIRTTADVAATQKQLTDILLPAECNDKAVVYVRLRSANNLGVTGESVPANTPSFLHKFTVTGEH